MTSRPYAQRLAEHLIRRACRHLPQPTRDERYREWAAELPAILHDPDIRFGPARSARALLYAADHTRTTRRLPGTATKPRARALAAKGVNRRLWLRATLAAGGAVGIVAGGIYALGQVQQFITPANQITSPGTQVSPHTTPDYTLPTILAVTLLAVSAAALLTLWAHSRRSRGRAL